MSATDSPRLSSLDFDLEFDGEALAQHEMDVRDLAPALLSAGTLFQDLNRRVHPADPDVQVNIRATHEGSFLIQLKLLYDTYANVVTNPVLEGTEGLAGLLAVLVGIIRYIRKRGREGEHDSQQPVEAGLVRLTWPNGTTLDVPAESLRLADDATVRRELAQLVRPIGRPGIDEVRIIRDDVVVGSAEKVDLPAFEAWGQDPNQALTSSRRQTVLRILTSAFQVGRKWRFSDGRGSFWADIEDNVFNERIAHGERFGSHDRLICDVRETQWLDDDGDLHAAVTIERVLDRLDSDTIEVEQLTLETGASPSTDPPPRELGPGQDPNP